MILRLLQFVFTLLGMIFVWVGATASGTLCFVTAGYMWIWRVQRQLEELEQKLTPETPMQWHGLNPLAPHVFLYGAGPNCRICDHREKHAIHGYTGD